MRWCVQVIITIIKNKTFGTIIIPKTTGNDIDNIYLYIVYGLVWAGLGWTAPHYLLYSTFIKMTFTFTYTIIILTWNHIQPIKQTNQRMNEQTREIVREQKIWKQSVVALCECANSNLLPPLNAERSRNNGKANDSQIMNDANHKYTAHTRTNQYQKSGKQVITRSSNPVLSIVAVVKIDYASRMTSFIRFFFFVVCQNEQTR